MDGVGFLTVVLVHILLIFFWFVEVIFEHSIGLSQGIAYQFSIPKLHKYLNFYESEPMEIK